MENLATSNGKWVFPFVLGVVTALYASLFNILSNGLWSVCEWAVPPILKEESTELGTYLGLINYHPKFIITNPLNSLLQREQLYFDVVQPWFAFTIGYRRISRGTWAVLSHKHKMVVLRGLWRSVKDVVAILIKRQRINYNQRTRG